MIINIMVEMRNHAIRVVIVMVVVAVILMMCVVRVIVVIIVMSFRRLMMRFDMVSIMVYLLKIMMRHWVMFHIELVRFTMVQF